MIKQTYEERLQVKEIVLKSRLPKTTLNKVKILDDTTRFTDRETNEVFTCLEVQLMGCLIDDGLKRRYVSYADFENYEVSN